MSLSLRVRFNILRRDGFRCRYCGRSAKDGVVLQVDHVKAMSRGGSDMPDNLVTACWPCNIGKKASELNEWNVPYSTLDELLEELISMRLWRMANEDGMNEEEVRTSGDVAGRARGEDDARRAALAGRHDHDR